MRVGDTIWLFDINHREYSALTPEENAIGKRYSSGGAIYRSYWVPCEIKDETSRSWVTNRGKAPKRGGHDGWAFCKSEVDDDVWVNDHRYKIVRVLQSCGDAEVIREVAGLLGYNTGGM